MVQAKLVEGDQLEAGDVNFEGVSLSIRYK